MKDKEFKLKSNVIKDYFYLNNDKIVVLENKAFKGVDKDVLILAKLTTNGKEYIIESLTDKEYGDAVKKYELLIKMIEEDVKYE